MGCSVGGAVLLVVGKEQREKTVTNDEENPETEAVTTKPWELPQ